MMMTGQNIVLASRAAIALTVTLTFGLKASADQDQSTKRGDMAFRHVMYEHFQGDHRSAYVEAKYYQDRKIQSESMLLAQASATLELGYLEHGRALIRQLETSSLLPENQSRLRLYLARDAYRRRDWPLLEEQLDLLAGLELEKEQQNYQSYLHFELVRHQGAADQASRFLSQIDRDFDLYPFGLFNLAAIQSDSSEAIEILLQLLEIPAQSPADLALRDRARLALAELYFRQDSIELAQDQLVQVSATNQYGPVALGQLAQLYMQQGQFETAAALWQHLVDKHPWHPASIHGPGALGYSLQKARGNEAAFSVYQTGLVQLETRQNQLAEASANLNGVRHDPDFFNSDELYAWLTDNLGHDDWTSWITTSEVRELLRQWQSLDQAHQKLKLDQDKLGALFAVDKEQQSRVRGASDNIRDNNIEAQLLEIKSHLSVMRLNLSKSKVSIEDNLIPFASPAQNQTLEEIERLKDQLEVLAPDQASIAGRIGRLEGLVRFAIHSDIPKTKQRQIQNLSDQIVMAENAAERLNRITLAAEHHPMSVSARIQNVAARVALLERDAAASLAESRQQMLAGIESLIQRDTERLSAQIAGLQYDLTRLADQRIARANN